MMSSLFVVLLQFHILNGLKAVTKYNFAFGNTQGSNMVLQQQPHRAQVWGTSALTGANVVIELLHQSNSQLVEKVTVNADNTGIWSTYFNPISASNNEYMITATNGTQNISMEHILFGDVYICGGQSNMQFTVDQAFNASEEVQAANDYPYIRVFTASETSSDAQQIELLSVEEQWSVASNISIGHGNWSYMSAMCWFFGKNMWNYLQYPVGLIGTNYGGTPIRYWSSPDALAVCNESYIEEEEKRGKEEQQNKNILTNHKYYSNDINTPDIVDSGLWNSMIYPFLQTTIRAAIWYQGESDSNPTYAAPYACQFPAMIEDWRLKWSLYSDTSPDFPFGYVQLSTWGDSTNNITCGNNVGCTDAAIVRWAQSANYGFVPNTAMKNTFMATAVDLGDPNSPFTDIHPRYKQQVADRLSTAGKDIMYGESSLYWQGPIADVATNNGNNIMINFRNVGEKGLIIKNSYGFEVYSQSTSSWITSTGSLTTNGNYNIVLPVPSGVNGADVTQVRYNWFQAPCSPTSGIYQCAIYDGQYQLPATPFIISISS